MMKKFNCAVCGVEFETPTKGLAKYCPTCKKKVASLATMKSRQKRIPSTVIGCGSGHHNTQNRKNSHYWKVRQDPGKCERCGSTDKLHWHHIDFDHSNNVAENLMRLCKSCHSKVHHFETHFHAEVKPTQNGET